MEVFLYLSFGDSRPALLLKRKKSGRKTEDLEREKNERRKLPLEFSPARRLLLLLMKESYLSTVKFSTENENLPPALAERNVSIFYSTLSSRVHQYWWQNKKKEIAAS